MTDDWVGSMCTITISDDDDDDADVPTDNQPNDSSHSAAEPAPCRANNPSTVTSDAAPENGNASCPSHTEDSDAKTLIVEILNATDTKSSAEILVSGEKTSIDIPLAENINIQDVDYLKTTQLMDTGADVLADVSTGMDIPVIDSGQEVKRDDKDESVIAGEERSQSADMKKVDDNKCMMAVGNQDSINGLLTYLIICLIMLIYH